MIHTCSWFSRGGFGLPFFISIFCVGVVSIFCSQIGGGFSKFQTSLKPTRPVFFNRDPFFKLDGKQAHHRPTTGTTPANHNSPTSTHASTSQCTQDGRPPRQEYRPNTAPHQEVNTTPQHHDTARTPTPANNRPKGNTTAHQPTPEKRETAP